MSLFFHQVIRPELKVKFDVTKIIITVVVLWQIMRERTMADSNNRIIYLIGKSVQSD